MVDTNVAISAAVLPRSVPRQAFDAAVVCNPLLISDATTIDLDVIRRPKVNKYVAGERRLELQAALVRDATQKTLVWQRR
jgi:predicted nucleic acid-binding protein